MRTLKRLAIVAMLSALALAMGACGSGTSGSTVTQTKTVIEQPPDSSSQQEPSGGGSDSGSSGGGSDSGGARWTMPDETGKDLQAAQDDIQSLTNDAVYFTDSHDATGQDRMQILDRDWQVCTEDPAPGTKITPDTKIDFGVVRAETETCP